MDTHTQICSCAHITNRKRNMEPGQKMPRRSETDEQTIEVAARDQAICVVINSGRYQITVEIE